jgi:hypothetical protein
MADLNPYMRFRRMILGLRRSDYEMVIRQHRVHAVLVDTFMDGSIFSVACVVDGSFSLYYGEGGGIIGMGQKYKELAMAARAFVYGAEQAIPNCEAAESFDLPGDEERCFYLVTDGQVFKTISKMGSMATDPKQIQILNFVLDKVMEVFFECIGKEKAERGESSL